MDPSSADLTPDRWAAPAPADSHQTPSQPDHAPATASRRARVRLIALAAGALVLLVFGIAIGAALWVDGGLPAALGFTHRDSPKVVAGHYLDQLTAGNPGEANTLVCKAERDRNGGTGPIGLRLTGLVKYQVGEEHITEKTARVDVDVTVPVLGQLTIAIRLVDEDGQWRVCGGGLGARASAGAGSATTS